MTSVLAPDGAAHRGGRRVRFVALTVAVALVSSTGGWWLAHELDNMGSVDTARHQDAAQREVDGARPPIDVTVTQDTFEEYDPVSFPNTWYIVLDKPLSAQAQQALTAIPVNPRDFREHVRKVWELLRPMGGRLLTDQPTLVRAPEHFTYNGTATSFRLGLESRKTAPVNIDDITADDVDCVPADAATVVRYPPEGESPMRNLALDLSGRSKVLVVEDEGGQQGKPYFQGASIALGQNQTGSNLKIDAITKNETCTFKLKADYRVAGEAAPGAPLEILAQGKPFKAEGVPARAVQYFERGYGDVPWYCAGTVEPGICDTAGWLQEHVK
ncbi:hypothetical protein ACIQOW_08740 [Kitasatospora sp. NPDC091335]|uniref:hypothetical protein n=1 Tax=Kitasatospora sp. NPDC091335 TaxID=3364085 RepID=UPI003827D073